MVTSVWLYLAFLGLLYAERAVELVVSRRNLRRAFAAGAVEVGRGHYPVMVAVHALFPLACGAEVLVLHREFPGGLGFAMLGVAVACQALRWWAIATLGWRWNTRIVVAPGAAPVTAGPYRFLRHPNYLAVLIESASVPLIHGAWLSAVVFAVANAGLLSVRIPAEERALGTTWAERFANRPRFLPEARHG
ncbi:MAG: isoprenylcysteine carboxylmethyltransferase family protein [Acidobacteriota bacterium]